MNSKFLRTLASCIAIFGAALGLFASAASAQAVTGAWSPASVAGSTNATLTLSYTGFSTQNIGYKFRVYYDNTKVTFVSAASTVAPAAAFQGDSGELADGANGDGDSATNSFVELNWADLGNAWPTNASGTLGMVVFTTASNFAGTSVNLRESAASAQARGVAGSSAALLFAEPSPIVTIGAFTDNTCATAAPALNDAAGQSATICVVSSLTRVNPLNVTLTPAAANGRYSTTCGATIQIAAGQSRATCTVTATANTTPFDGSATATTALANGSGYTLGSPNSATVTVNNDDNPTVTVTPAGPTNLPDNGASQTVTVTLSATAPSGFVVPLTSPAANLRLGGTCIGLTSIAIPAGQTSATCTVIAAANTTAGDGPVPANVAANCTSTCTNGNPSTAQITVTDDDIPVINVTCAATSIVDSAGATGATTCTFRNSLAVGATGFNVAFTQSADPRYTISGCTSPLTVPANTAANSVLGTCTVTATANTTPGDGSVNAAINVSAGSGYSAGTGGTVAINDDDKSTISVAINGAASVAEGDAGAGSPITFRFTSSVASLAATTVKFSLPANARYAVGGASGCTSGSVVLAASQATFDCTVTPNGNTTPDGNVPVTVSVTPDAAYNVGGSPAVGTITDDDVAINAAAGASGSAAVNSTPEGTVVRFSVSCPTLATAQTINFAITPATAYAGDVYSGSPTGSVTCPAAAASVVAVPTTVQTINDTTIGNARTYTMTISIPQVMIGAANNGLKAGAAVAATNIGNAVARVDVTDDDQPLVVPTMSMLGLGFMSLMLAGFVAFQRRRVQK